MLLRILSLSGRWSFSRRAGSNCHVHPLTTWYRWCSATTSAESEMMSDSGDSRLIWVDLEMTGLSVDRDHIMEMACVITDRDLNIVAEGPDIIIHQPAAVLDEMGDWCREHHGKCLYIDVRVLRDLDIGPQISRIQLKLNPRPLMSGLTAACRDSKISLAEAEQQMLAFVQQHTPQRMCPLAGNTIHMDKRFLDKYMPVFTAHLHYRLVDVSSVKELCRRWYPKEFRQAPLKILKHRALDDIKESIKELEYYRKTIFK